MAGLQSAGSGRPKGRPYIEKGEPPPEAHRSEQTVDGHEVVLGLVRGAL